MARASSRRAIQHFITFLLIGCTACQPLTESPEFTSLSVTDHSQNNDAYNEFFLDVQGKNLHGNKTKIRLTTKDAAKNEICDNADLKIDYELSEVRTNGTSNARFKLRLPKSVCGNVYLCLLHEVVGESAIPPGMYTKTEHWYHQGNNFVVKVPLNENCNADFERKQVEDNLNRERRDLDLRVTGLRLDIAYKEVEIDDNGAPYVRVGTNNTLRLFGTGFSKDMLVTFTSEPSQYGGGCQLPIAKYFPIIEESLRENTVQVVVNLPALAPNADAFYVCIKKGNYSDSSKTFVHQGSEDFISLKSNTKLLPVWASIIIIVVCLSFSSLFSGLNLGLMSLDRTELKILCNTGTAKERKYARIIQPVRDHGNYLLCSILLGNVLVNSIFTILLDDLTSGLIAVVFSTLAIVLFGEITPQAVCSRHGLAIGAKTIHITKVVMVLTFPLAYPISKMLDWVLGEEIGSVYTRERLKELVKVTTGENDLDRDEVNIISGALELRRKTVADVMTRIEDVFMLDYEAVLDFETVSEIMKSGYSRIPVYEGNRQNIVTMLYIKDLAFVDPDDNTPLKTLCQFYQNPCNFVFEDVTLDVMFRIFKEGNKGHMAFVHRVNNEGEGDPFYETVGLITLEDVIEELIQAEIMDETDVFTDNRSKRRRNADRTRQDFSVFAEKRADSSKVHMSPQLTLAAYQYLNTSVEAFSKTIISETILRRLLKQDIVYHIKKNKDWRNDPACVIYQRGKPADYFVLVLEGRVEVTIGQENLVFESGPFTYLGTQALAQNVGVAESPIAPSALGSLESINLDSMMRHIFQPDYTVRACTEVLYLRVKRSLYLAAKRATLMERSQKDTATTGEQFDDEVEKLLHSLEEEDDSHWKYHKKSSTKSLHKQDSSAPPAGAPLSQNTSPKTPSVYSNMSPPHRVSPHDVNGSIKSNPLDDGYDKSEESSLLPAKS